MFFFMIWCSSESIPIHAKNKNTATYSGVMKHAKKNPKRKYIALSLKR